MLTGWRATDVPVWLQALGWVALAAGAVVLLEAFARFVVEGVGTPAPAAPTERLVVGGLYYDESWTVLSLLMLTGNFLDYTAL